MIKDTSTKIVNYLENNHMLKEDKAIYIYSVNIIISTLIGTLYILLIGILTDYFIEAILFECIFSTSRAIMGGYHCKSYVSCIVTYVTIFIICILLNEAVTFQKMEIILLEIFSLINTWKLAPVQNIAKNISFKKKQIFKKYSLLYIFIYSTIINFIYQFNININWFICLLIAIQILLVGGELDYEKSCEFIQK